MPATETPVPSSAQALNLLHCRNPAWACGPAVPSNLPKASGRSLGTAPLSRFPRGGKRHRCRADEPAALTNPDLRDGPRDGTRSTRSSTSLSEHTSGRSYLIRSFSQSRGGRARQHGKQ